MNKKKCYGLILDKGQPVGGFNIITAEDSYGLRRLKDVVLNSKYFDVSSNSSKELHCVMVEEITPDYIKAYDDFGLGIIKRDGSAWCSLDKVLLKEATFSKSPKPTLH